MSETISPEGHPITEFFKVADSLDLARLMPLFGDEIELRMANNPPVRGRKAVEAVFRDFWSNLSGMRHQARRLIGDDNWFAQVADVTYTRRDGKVVTLPASSFLHRQTDGRVDRLWIFIDPTPLFAA